jgi:hypothetical protein
MQTPRLAIWRKVKRLGAAQVLDVFVALPLDNRICHAAEWSRTLASGCALAS